MTRPRAAKRCCRCLGEWRFGFNWPEGFVCRSCETRATTQKGRCPGCSDENASLVGRDADGQAICADCAGITTSYWCTTCGREDQTWFAATCMSCSVARQLTDTLDDGTGHVAPFLVPLFDRLVAAPRPVASMQWVRKPMVAERLSALARGAVPLTHDGIDTFAARPEPRAPPGTAPRPRPPASARDKYLAAFETWTTRRLATIDDPTTAGEIERYLAWHQLRVLRLRSEAGPLRASVANSARDQTDAGVRFLAFLADVRARALRELRQADVDAWFAEASNPHAARDFLVFARAQRRCPRVVIPEPSRRSAFGASVERLATIARRLVDDETIDLPDRVAGLLVVLLAQPVTRICRLHAGQVVGDGTAMALQLGTDPIPVPDGLAVLLRRLATNRTDTDYLFPGGRPGHPVTAAWMTTRLNRLDITRLERQGALTRLLGQVPAAIVARATGYYLEASTSRASLAGDSFANYARLKTAAGR